MTTLIDKNHELIKASKMLNKIADTLAKYPGPDPLGAIHELEQKITAAILLAAKEARIDKNGHTNP